MMNGMEEQSILAEVWHSPRRTLFSIQAQGVFCLACQLFSLWKLVAMKGPLSDVCVLVMQANVNGRAQGTHTDSDDVLICVRKATTNFRASHCHSTSATWSIVRY